MAHYSTAQKRAQNYLRGIKIGERQIQLLEAEIELQQERLQLNGVAFGEHVNSTMSGKAAEEGFTKLYEYCDKLDTELCGYVEERDEALEVINKLNDAMQREVLYLFYFRCFTFSSIAKILGYTRKSIYSYHDQALSNLYRFIPKQFR